MNQESSSFDLRESFKKALDAHRSGNLDSAETIYREILLLQPENAHVIHLLGVVSLQKGRTEEACELIEAAIKHDAGHAPFHCNLGEALRLRGMLEEAEKRFLAALELEPRNLQALTNLGITLHQRGRHGEAVARLQRALELAGPSADVYSNLGLAQFADGALDDAISSLRKAVELNPRHVEANNNLGTALLEKNEIEAAAFVLEEAVSINRGSADAWCNLARARVAQSQLAAAEEYARRAVELGPDQSKFHFVLGLVLHNAGRPAEAESALRRSLEIAPKQAAAHHVLATVYIGTGRFEEAKAALESALALNPELTVAYEALSQIQSYGVDDLPEIERLEQFAKSLDIDSPARMHLEFALSNMLDDCNEFDLAFSHMQTANELKQAQLRFDAAELWQTVEDTKRDIDSSLIEQKARFGSDSKVPILIVGMPCSGTTLLEHILAAHPDISGAGEVGYANAAAQTLARESGHSYPLCVAELSETMARGLTEEYLARIAQVRVDARHVTDTWPQNFVHLGLFLILFPRARIVHCIREPVDTCFSIYAQNFQREHEFAYDLQHIGEYYRIYRSMMEHWRTVVPNQIFEVSCEQLVEDREKVCRKLLGHLALPWDERCLHPLETSAGILTAGHWRVRYFGLSRSLARWRQYEHHLGPLIEALGDTAQGAKLPSRN